jgi:hypothetical protein
MAIVSEAVANAKADIDRLTAEIDAWARDFIELLGAVTHWDLVFTEAEGMDISYIALCDWDQSGGCARMVVIRTIPAKAHAEQRKMALAITSVLTAFLHRFGHFDVGVALLADTGGKIFRHEGLAARCRSTLGCARIPEAESQFNFSSIPGHVLRSSPPVVLN